MCVDIIVMDGELILNRDDATNALSTVSLQ